MQPETLIWVFNKIFVFSSLINRVLLGQEKRCASRFRLFEFLITVSEYTPL